MVLALSGIVVGADIIFDDMNLWGNDIYNATNVNTTNVNAVIGAFTNITLSNHSINHKIYDNSTCIIITGDTSTLVIC